MAWQRGGDTSATYPALMAVRADPQSDARTVNEVAGFIWRLSTLAAAHLTDYVLDPGTIEMIGGPRTDELLRLTLRQGLLTKVKGGGYRLISDPDFIHLRSRAEVERERQQRSDTRDYGLVVPVRLRDGDNCRWCGVEVIWPGRKTARSGELDHLFPDKLEQGTPTTVDDLLVACRRCNRQRGGNRPEWDSAHVLRAVPPKPYYSDFTARFLTDNGYPTAPSSDAERLALAPGAEPAPTTGVRPATGLSDGTARVPDVTPESPSNLPRVSDSRSADTGIAGSGRDGSGTGRVGAGGPAPTPARGESPPQSQPQPQPRPSRRRRGRRGGQSRGENA